MNDTISVSVQLHNTGEQSTAEVVQLYSQDSVASITPSVNRLRAFHRVVVGAGETQEVHFSLPIQDLGFIGQDMKYTVEPGAFGLRIGSEVVGIQIKEFNENN
jgi:beta-glucosidase